ncbi:tetratricopeptide repeat protein [Mesorhizobium carmichaelinearum]|uniref:tetratricopeptide repeat protein n=1 Tax=Mesorhizobium carmichaelinearum TaxID=1208188 RepID=UPI001FCED3A1|nr:pyridoxamine 5'-phosphate oxidase family protein [Mesorhizobium carmichaelinearum]
MAAYQREITRLQCCGRSAIYFLVNSDSAKNKQLSNYPKVTLAWSDSSHYKYVTISGTARVTNDREKIAELWEKTDAAWWDNAEDPDIRPAGQCAGLDFGRIARAERRFDAALQQLDRAAKLSSQAEILIERARTLEQAGDASAAGASWTLVLQRDPKFEEAMARLGRLAWQRRAPVEAEGFLERAVACGGHATAWFDLGLLRQDMRKFGSAAEAYRRVLEMRPDAPEAAVNLGVVLQETGDTTEPWQPIHWPMV